MANSPLRGPFSGDVKAAPSPHATGKGRNEVAECVNNPEDTEVLSTVFQVEVQGLKHGPAKMESPFENDFRPGVNSER